MPKLYSFLKDIGEYYLDMVSRQFLSAVSSLVTEFCHISLESFLFFLENKETKTRSKN